MSESTAVAVSDVKKRGQQMLVHQREVRDLARQIEGMQWGSGSSVVKGAGFSEQARYALAKFCGVIGAEPQTQLDMLGGKPYPNANYWMDRLSSEVAYVDTVQKEITEATEQKLRARAKDHREIYNALKESDPSESARALKEAVRLEGEADYIAEARAHWSPPSSATAAYETTIRRFMNAAPLDKIQSGEMSREEVDEWIIEVKECNWAPNAGGDPVGKQHPEKSARTRSLRRCAIRAFSLFQKKYAEQVEKAEHVLEAEWEMVEEDAETRRAIANAPTQAATGNGEPEAANPKGARALPVEGQEDDDEPDHEIVQEDEPEPEPDFDVDDMRKRLFATLRDAGFDGDTRKAWCEENDLPASTKEWTKDHYTRALDLLYAPVRDDVLARVEAAELDLGDLSLSVIGRESPDYLKHWQALQSALDARGVEAAPEDVGAGEDL